MPALPVEETPYTRQELQRKPQFPPLRGLYCPHCKMRIPQFADIADEDWSRINLLKSAATSWQFKNYRPPPVLHSRLLRVNTVDLLGGILRPFGLGISDPGSPP